MDANVVMEIIKNTLKTGAWDDLMVQHDKFSFVNVGGTKNCNGPTMMKVLLENIDPSSSINIELHRQAIENAKLRYFKGNISELLNVGIRLERTNPTEEYFVIRLKKF